MYRAMDKHPTVTAVQLDGLDALMGLAMSNDNAGAIMTSGGAERVVRVMETYLGSAAIQRKVMRFWERARECV